MKLISSFIVTLCLLTAIYVVLHYVFLFLKLNDLLALILFALPLCFYIAYATHDNRHDMIRAGASIFGWFVFVVCASAGLVLFIS